MTEEPEEEYRERQGPLWIEPFLNRIAEGHSIASACRLMGLHRSRVYDYRARHDWFDDAVRDCRIEGAMQRWGKARYPRGIGGD